MSVKRMEKAALKERGAEIDLKIARTEEMRLEEMQMLTESWEEDLVVHTDPTAMRVAGSRQPGADSVPSAISGIAVLAPRAPMHSSEPTEH